MTANTNPLFDPRVAEWLEDDPELAPSAVLETVLAAVPSVPQSHSRPRLIVVLRERRAWMVVGVAAVLAVLAFAGLRLIKLAQYGEPPRPTPLVLDQRVDVPARYYAIRLPRDWVATLGTGDQTPDVFSGPEGLLSVKLITIPQGVSQDQWSDSYFDAEAAKLDPGCAPGDKGAFDAIRIGSESGLLYKLACPAGWWVLFAVGDRAYDMRMMVKSGTADAASRALLLQLMNAVVLQLGPAATSSSVLLDPTTWIPFTSSRHGISLRFPADWSVTAATAPWIWTPLDPGPRDEATDRAVSASDSAFVVASQKVPAGMTDAAWWADYLSVDTSLMPGGCFPATQAAYQPIVVDGQPAFVHGGIGGCNFTEAIALVGGRAYQLTAYVSIRTPKGEVFDRGVFDTWLSTVVFDPASADDTPVEVSPQPT